jgi:hypothetical protein
MSSKPPPLSPTRFRFAWKLFKSWRAEARGEFSRALGLIDEAAEIMPLGPSDRVQRAMLLLRNQNVSDANKAFIRLRDEFKGTEENDLKYLRHYCTAMLSVMQPGSGQWAYEAKQAQQIKCSPGLKSRFPLVTVDEIHDRIKPRR